MDPAEAMHLLNYFIIVLVSTIVYCIGLIIYRVYDLCKRMAQREHDFMQSVYFQNELKKAVRMEEEKAGKVRPR